MAGSVLAIGMLTGCGKQTEQGEGEKISIVSDMVGKAPAGTMSTTEEENT